MNSNIEIKRDYNGDCKIGYLLEDGLKIESLIIESRKTFPTIYCISSQAGCPVKCKFCNNGSRDFHRNLSVKELIGQVNVALDYTTTNPKMPFCVTFMGVGEPLYNLKNVCLAINELANKYKNLCSFSLSTICIPDKIRVLSNLGLGKPLYLQFSLHSPFQEEREKLFGSRLSRISDSIDSLIYYSKRTRTDIWVNYVLFKGINDSEEHISEISKKFDRKTFKFKVSSYTRIKDSNLIPANKKKINIFLNKLKKEGFYAVHRNNVGIRIGGACGHLIASK